MNKQPQNIIKISSQEEGGAYLQMVFDAGSLDHWEITKRFHNFLRGAGYNIRYPNIAVEDSISVMGKSDPDETWNPAG